MNKIRHYLVQNLRYTALLAAVAGVYAPSARADRIVNFYGSGRNAFYDTKVSSTSSSQPICQITIVNSSPSPIQEDITVTISGTINGASQGYVYVTVPGVTAVAPAVPPLAGYALPYTDASARTLNSMNSNGDTVIYEWWPTAIVGGTAVNQEMVCQGTIKVADHVSSQPGFITASGSITTFTEASGGRGVTGASGASSATPSTTPSQTVIVIGEGRPF